LSPSGKRPAAHRRESSLQSVRAALAVMRALAAGDLLNDPRDRAQMLPCIPLMQSRGDHAQLLPSEVERVEIGEHLLLCGKPAAVSAMEWTLQSDKVLHDLLTGREMPKTWVWQWIDRRLARHGRGN
jgi:hypothetical protein